MIDTHCHIYLADYDDDRAEVLRRATQAGVERMLCPAVGSESHEALVRVCRENPNLCLPMVGVHPTVVNDNPAWRDELAAVEKLLASPPVPRWYAIGEVGLDLHWSRDFLAEQTEAFERQIELALSYNLPIAIHTRDAWEEMLAVLEKYAGRGLHGVLHAFSGGVKEYERVRAAGDFVFGIGGPLTYKNSGLREVLPQMALESLVVETDAPWLSPVPFRGQRNEPANAVYVARAMAEILGVSVAGLEQITDENAGRIFFNLRI